MTEPGAAGSTRMCVVEYVPLVLPEGWTEERLDAHGWARLRAWAAEHGRDVVGDALRVQDSPVVVDDGGGVTPCAADAPGAVRLVKWSAPTAPKSEAPSTTIIQAVESCADGVWTADVPATAGPIIGIRHGLDTECVRVEAYRLGGHVPYHASTPISRGEVEVILTTQVDHVEVRAFAGDDQS